MSDLIRRADALEQMAQAECGSHYADCEKDNCSCSYISRILDIPSAEAVTHGRLIDADALSEKLCETTIFIKDGEVFQRMINDAPTVSAEAVQGEWISLHNGKWKCSECGIEVLIYAKGNFCPNCGAKMKSEVKNI